jgi:hypothetical protein
MDFGWDMGGGDWLGPLLVLVLVGVVVYLGYPSGPPPPAPGAPPTG